MPAIASLEDLKAAQKEGLGIYAMLYALCSMLYEVGFRNSDCGIQNVRKEGFSMNKNS